MPPVHSKGSRSDYSDTPRGFRTEKGKTPRHQAKGGKSDYTDTPRVESYEEDPKFFIFLNFFDFFLIFLISIRLDFGIEPIKIKKIKKNLDLVFDFFRFFSQACRFANAHEKIQLKSN